MKKFVLMTVGFTQPTPEVMEAWMSWFKSIGEHIVEQVGLANGTEIGTDGSTRNLPMDAEAITGYLVIQVANKDEAVKIAEACPAVSSTRVYEIMQH